MISSLSAVHVTGTVKRIQSLHTRAPQSGLWQVLFAHWTQDWNRSFWMNGTLPRLMPGQKYLSFDLRNHVQDTKCYYTITGPYGCSLTTWHHILAVCEPTSCSHLWNIFWALSEFLFRYSERCSSALVTPSMQSAPVPLRIEMRCSAALYECLQWQTNGITLNSFRAFISQNNSIHNSL